MTVMMMMRVACGGFVKHDQLLALSLFLGPSELSVAENAMQRELFHPFSLRPCDWFYARLYMSLFLTRYIDYIV